MRSLIERAAPGETTQDAGPHLVALALNTLGRFRRACRSVERIDWEQMEFAAIDAAAHAWASHDPARGALATHVIGRVGWRLREELREWDWLPRRRRDEADAVRTETGEYPEWAIPPASLSEPIASYDGVRGHRHIFLEEILSCDQATPETEALSGTAADALWAEVAHLPKKQREFVRRYYLLGQMDREIAAALAVSESRVHQLRRDALARLRASPLADWFAEVAEERLTGGKGFRLTNAPPAKRQRPGALR